MEFPETAAWPIIEKAKWKEKTLVFSSKSLTLSQISYLAIGLYKVYVACKKNGALIIHIVMNIYISTCIQ